MATILSDRTGNWNAPTTWVGGVVPGAGDDVTVQVGHTVTYNVLSALNLNSVTVNGTLQFSTTVSTELDTGLLQVNTGGQVLCATNAVPLPASLTCRIRLVDLGQPQPAPPIANIPPGLWLNGGTLKMFGAKVVNTWVRLTADKAVTETVLPVEASVDDWLGAPGWDGVGREIVISGTDAPVYATDCIDPLFGSSQVPGPLCADNSSFHHERKIVASVGPGNQLTLATGLSFAHLGTGTKKAKIGLLTRNIRIDSKSIMGLRGHTKFGNDTDATSVGVASFIEFADLGRKGRLGVYPVHFHKLVGNGTLSSVVGCSVHDSQNTGITVHNTHKALVSRNVVFNIVSHGIRTEDGSEALNVFDSNLCVRCITTRKSALIDQNPATDPDDLMDGSGIWTDNANNTLTNNACADCDEWGISVFPRVNPPAADAGPYRADTLDTDGNPAMNVVIRTLPIKLWQNNECHTSFEGAYKPGDIHAGPAVFSVSPPPSMSKSTRAFLWGSAGGTPRGFSYDLYPVDGINERFEGLVCDNADLYGFDTFAHTFDNQCTVGFINIDTTNFGGWVVLEGGPGALPPGHIGFIQFLDGITSGWSVYPGCRMDVYDHATEQIYCTQFPASNPPPPNNNGPPKHRAFFWNWITGTPAVHLAVVPKNFDNPVGFTPLSPGWVDGDTPPAGFPTFPGCQIAKFNGTVGVQPWT